MVSLRNSKSSQHVTVQQLSEAIALEIYEVKIDADTTNAEKSQHRAKSLPNFKVTTSTKLSKKLIKKLGQKTKRTLLSLQARLANNNSVGGR